MWLHCRCKVPACHRLQAMSGREVKTARQRTQLLLKFSDADIPVSQRASQPQPLGLLFLAPGDLHNPKRPVQMGQGTDLARPLLAAYKQGVYAAKKSWICAFAGAGHLHAGLMAYVQQTRHCGCRNAEHTHFSLTCNTRRLPTTTAAACTHGLSHRHAISLFMAASLAQRHALITQLGPPARQAASPNQAPFAPLAHWTQSQPRSPQAPRSDAPVPARL